MRLIESKSSQIKNAVKSKRGGRNMTTYLLIHGAWHGGWCWKHVARLLRTAGHEVFTPTLTGLGERAHLLNPDVGLDTHVQDVLGVLEYEDVRDVVLVGRTQLRRNGHRGRGGKSRRTNCASGLSRCVCAGRRAIAD